MKNTIAIIGTNGIPAKYGGFETLAEYLAINLSEKYDVTVYCSKLQKKNSLYKNTYNNVKLKYLSLNANGYQSILYDGLSIIHALFNTKILIVLGGGGTLPIIFCRMIGKYSIVNHGGFNEWEREKYNYIARLFSYYTRKISASFIDIHVADNPVLAKSLNNEFEIKARIIEYGGDHIKNDVLKDKYLDKYPFLSESYYLCIARAQYDNELHVVIDAFKQIKTKKIVIISNWSVSDYGLQLYSQNQNISDNILLINAVYDINELSIIRNMAYVYIHSHTRCGSAPSLIEAMCSGMAIISRDKPTNRYTTNNSAIYYKNKQELISAVEQLSAEYVTLKKNEMLNLAKTRYTWDRITKLYEDCIEDVLKEKKYTQKRSLDHNQ